ncbi:hypothetical protein [Bradyrhizobium valentinum]|uniref:Uncharacterized protein n=1 Tax=Bradyrhizobium valentinum TaxID=1518501 RepID=A0A0R3KJ48_9BRAD|nr:hypothetical protein [Bradyrhizobium valentinum]KRQ95798.1 hypothetical protein CP49_31765 [Bradyrhizobium valentinum]KRR11137.1 hypothetical protein CQ10_12105 [Bradyrhizobium valentinum]
MPQSHFLIEAFDLEQWCPVLQAMLPVDDPEALRAILAGVADDDPELEKTYFLDDEELAAIVATFNVSFDAAQLDSKDLEISLFRWRSSDRTPYLTHTGYELPLLLEGRKKLARMSGLYPPMAFEGEDRFELWVTKGVLHREEVNEPFDQPVQTSHGQTYLGQRIVYYTPKGEEWRIRASKLIWDASGKSGGWNECFERLEGMLFGYEDWQNDWWITRGITGGGFDGLSCCCMVTAGGLAWIEAAGFRALPPIDGPTLAIMMHDWENEADQYAAMLGDPESVAVARFNMLGRDFMNFWTSQRGGPWHLPAVRIAEFNRFLRGSVEIVARRDDAATNVRSARP